MSECECCHDVVNTEYCEHGALLRYSQKQLDPE